MRPSYADYVAALTAAAPGLFSGRYSLVTEFGRSLLAKNGFIGARVEYTKDAGGRRIALTHAGAQTATRTVLMPDAWPLRIGAFGPDGTPKTGPSLAQDIAGPCCFAGDVVAYGRELPELAEDDVVVLYDTGAYYFSTPWAYNSLPRPAVYGFRAVARPEDGSGHGGPVTFATVRDAQSLDDIAAESGLAHADALIQRDG
ncbi:diaminopimelate decarboxylase [Streptomyces sp. W4I9-2]|nr:diaminopimelate decarboxylase [Streptomyces sp. W4I9-2]